MIITICDKKYEIEKKVDNLLSVLMHIKATKNNSLSFRNGCKSGVCGSCAVVVNGMEKLACKTTVKDRDIVEPLRNLKVIKDLVTDNSCQNYLLTKANAQLQTLSNNAILSKDEKNIDKESNCVLCNSCYSSCPVYSVNKNFIGPFALVRAYRYIEDKKEADIKPIIDSIQDDGVFSCTLCGNCNMVCPSLIDIKTNIITLQNKSVQNGYSNPNLSNGYFGGNMDFMTFA